MLRYITLLCVVPFLANCYWNDTLHDGPCPKLPTAEDEEHYFDKLPGDYWLESTNREIQNITPIFCAGAVVSKPENGEYKTVTSYSDKTGKRTVVKQKLVPLKGYPPGHWAAQLLNETTGTYTADGWTFTAAGIVDGGILEYACKQEGDKHKNFYQVFISKKNPPSKEKLEELLKPYEDSDDDRKMIDVKHDDCNKTKESSVNCNKQ